MLEGNAAVRSEKVKIYVSCNFSYTTISYGHEIVSEPEESLNLNHRQHLNLHLQGTSGTTGHVQHEKK